MESADWIVGGVLGFAGFAFYAGSRALASCAKDIESVEEVVPGPQLLERVQSGQCMPYLAVGGYVQPHPNSSRSLTYGSSQSPCVVKVTKTKEHAKEYSRASRSWYNTTKTVSRAYQAIPFVLTDSAHGGDAAKGASVSVHAHDSDFSKVLTKVESTFDSVNTGVGQSILGIFSGHKVTGYEYQEEVLPVAQFISVLGKVSLVGGSLVVESPVGHRFIVTTEPLADLAHDFRSRSKFTGILAFLFWTGLSVYALYRIKNVLKRYYDDWQRRQESRNFFAELEAAEETDGTSSDFCCICMDNRSTILVMDCRHLCLCPECSTKVDDCPICRRPIVSRVATFR